MNDLDELYQSVILDHDRRPRNFRELAGPGTREAEGYNPLCGDRFRVMVRVEDGVIRELGFTGSGCAISKASASLMTEALTGRSVAEAEELFERFHGALTGDAGSGGPGEQGSGRVGELPARLRVFRGVRAYPMRVKCATLAWHAMRQAIEAEPAGAG